MCIGIQNITLGGLSVYSATQGIILFVNLIWPELFKEKHHNIILAMKSLTVFEHNYYRTEFNMQYHSIYIQKLI